MKQIKVEWCENWIRAQFAKMPEGIDRDYAGIYTDLFWKLAERSGLWVRGTYGSPMSQALKNLCMVVDVVDDEGCCKYSVFKLKGSKLTAHERLIG
jgi:hypothetical protein